MLNQKAEVDSVKQLKPKLSSKITRFRDCEILKGIIARAVEFVKSETDCFENDSDMEPVDGCLPEGFDINGDEHDRNRLSGGKYSEDDDGNLIIPREFQ